MKRFLNSDLMMFIAVIALLWVGIAITGCSMPDPGPDPDPKKGAELVLVVVDDINTRGQSIVNDDRFWQQVEARGHAFKNVDIGNAAVEPFKVAAEKIGIPALLIYRARDMKLLHSEKLPEKTDRVDELVLKYGGKKERGPPIYLDNTGEVRKLGVKPPDEKAKARRMQMMGFGEFLKKKGVALIPAEKWVEVDYPRLHRSEFVLNQQQTSGCVGFSCAAANMKIRALRGMKFERLSGAFVYSLINGGRDQGAMIYDSCIALQKYGVCRDDENPLPNIYWRQVSDSAKQSAQQRQLTGAYRVENIQELATALQLGMIVQAGVQVDGSFESFDRNGVSSARGRYANHSIHIYGMKNIDGKWVYRMGNTWGATWGPFRDGSCFLRADGIVIEGDAFVHADSEWLPDDLPKPSKRVAPLSVMNPLLDQTNTKGPSNALADSRFILAQ